MVSRQSYSLLDWLGDLGGLFDALAIILGAFVAPVAAFSLKATILTKFFRFKPMGINSQKSLGKSTVRIAAQFFDLFYRKSENSKEDKLTIVKTIL